MSAPLILPQPGPPPQTPAAALQLVKASLDALAAKLGEVLQATVLGTDAQGLTQLRIGTETLTVKLSQPLPPGMQIRVEIQPTPSGAPVLVVQPRVATTQMAAPVVASSLPLPAPVMPPAGVPPPVSASTPSQAPVSAASASVPTAATGVATAPISTTTTPQPGTQGTPAAVAPRLGSTVAPIAMTTLPHPSAVPVPTAAAVMLPTGETSPMRPAPATTTAPATQLSATASPPRPIVSAMPLPTAAASTPAVAVPLAQPSPALPVTGPTPATATVATNVPLATSATSATAAATVPRPAPATSTSAPRMTTSLNLPLTQPAQAAARQDSMAPLLQNLSVLQRINEMPKPVVEAAMRLLAQRLPLDRGVPSGETIRQAIARSGVFLEPPGRLGTQQADVRSALLQLRAGLLGLLGGGEVAAVASVTRRPPPPLHDAQPRAIRAEVPNLSANAEPREAARTLLQQTEASLSRLKLTQLASQPADARQGAASVPDFVVELPMVLGHELSIAQLRVQRDGRNKGKAGERGWRLRFAVSFSLIGEVGAQISLLGKNTNVVLWADEAATADALEAMLPELAPALQARGLEVGSVRVRHGAPEAASPAAGRLMDELR